MGQTAEWEALKMYLSVLEPREGCPDQQQAELGQEGSVVVPGSQGILRQWFLR